MLQYTIEGTLVSVLFAVGFTVAMIFFGAMALGIFQHLRDSKSKVYGPLLEIFKHAGKQTSTPVTTSDLARKIVLLAWIVSSFAAFLFVSWGSFSLLKDTPAESALGNFQLFAVFGLLMVYPAGMMVICFVSKRKNSILNLKYLSEDFFSEFITFLVAMFSLFLIINGGFAFSNFPTIESMITLQGQETIGEVAFVGFFGLKNPLAMVAYFATIPLILEPVSFSEDPLSRKWTPLMDFTGKELSFVKTIRAIRLVTLVAFLVDVFLGGARFTSIWYIDVPAFFVIVVCLVAIMAGVKLRTSTWLLDKKINGFLRVHTLLALAGLVLSLALVYS
jgi:formate hydrogenlyase subunit 4